MVRVLATALFGVCLMVQAVSAQQDDAAFGDRVRAYLIENPQVIIEALELLSDRETQEKLVTKIAQYDGLFSDPMALGMGASDAPNQIIEFFDYKCAPCKIIHPKLEAFVSDYPNVRIVMRQLPILSPASERAARFAMAVQLVAGDDAYRSVHSALWNHKGAYNAATFAQISKYLSLDYAAIEDSMDNPIIGQAIAYNRDVAIDLEILGTPAFVTRKGVSFGSSDVEALTENWLSQ